ncbi:MAG: peptidylprolyl isomerase [Deltaproteobacteria bacterium]|nr:peptidylprolyl isomerase [Deltaproteobacteria bacterium]
MSRILSISILLAVLAAFGLACESKKAKPVDPRDAVKKVGDPGALPRIGDPTDPTALIAPLNPDDEKKPLVTFNGAPAITLGDFANNLKKQSPYIVSTYTTVEKKLDFLDSMVRFELMAKEALAQGLDKHPDVQRTLKQALIQKLMATTFESKLSRDEISDDDTKKYFDANPKEFMQPEQVQASQILIRTKPDASAAEIQKARERAKHVLQEVKAQAANPLAFGEFAKKHSEDMATKAQGGDMRFFTRAEEMGAFPKEVSDAAFALKKAGDVTPELVRSQHGFHILKLTDRKPPQQKPFNNTIKAQIKNRLYRDRREKSFNAFLAELREKAKVQIDKPLLDLVKVPKMSTTGGPPRLGGTPPGVRVTPVPAKR